MEQIHYTGKQVIRAGEDLISSLAEDDLDKFRHAMDVLSYWRYSHEYPLEQAIILLQEKTLPVDKSAIFAKRLKRYDSIVKKLQRFQSMKLKNMQDLGGCRAIVSTSKKVLKISRELKRHPSFKKEGKVRFKDYLTEPKEDGYRGFHIVGRFPDRDGKEKNIEIQIRTRLQHSWATALEIVDLFTGQALKSNHGDKDWKEFFLNVSNQLALMEEIHLFEVKTKKEQALLYKERLDIDVMARASSIEAVRYMEKLKVIKTFDAFANSLKILNEHIKEQEAEGDVGYALIEVHTDKSTVATTLFHKNDSEEAEKMYVAVEKLAAEKESMVVALVSATAVGGIREAYPNYFADSTDFLDQLSIISMAVGSAGRPKGILNWITGG